MSELTNSRIAAAFDELADLYELDGAIVHRVVAYRNAAKSVRETSRSVAELAREGRATELPGIGNTLQEKIVTLLETGDIPSAQRLRAQFPAGLVDLTRLPGLGPKRARRLFDELGIDSLDALREAAEAQRIRELKGFGAKAEESVLAALALRPEVEESPRVLLSKALDVAEAIVDALRAHPSSERVELAGSARRMTDTVKDVDVVATAHDPEALAQALVDLPMVEVTRAAAAAGARVSTHTGLVIDLRIVAPDQFGNLLQHFTGSKEHNMALRDAAVRRGLHVSEYGLLDDETGVTHRCATEEEVYQRLGYAYIEPELREGRGELQAAAGDGAGLPELVGYDALRGDLHCHTTASDGRNSIEDMALAARDRGYQYLAITDHSATHGFGNDVSAEQLERQIELVHEVNDRIEGIEVLAGTEVNILPDGSPDYPDELMARLDWAIGSVHTSFRMSQQEMTDRIVAATEHPWIDAIGHLTGRMLGRRPGYAVDAERIFESAAHTGTMIEINGNPNRRDMDEVNARAAAEAGVRVLVNSDAHGTNTLGVVRYGLATARRAWLTPEHVANTRPWAEFAPLRKRARSA